jgi:hypothetical protein
MRRRRKKKKKNNKKMLSMEYLSAYQISKSTNATDLHVCGTIPGIS